MFSKPVRVGRITVTFVGVSLIANMRSYLKLVLFAIFCLNICNAELVNEEVTRVIDLQTHLVKVTTTVTLKNGQGSAISSFRFTVDPSHAKQLAYISFVKVCSGHQTKL